MQRISETEKLSNPAQNPVEKPSEHYLRIVEEDLLTTLQFRPGSLEYSLMRFLFKKPLFHLAKFLVELDAHLAQNNVQSMASGAVERFASGLSIYGEPKIPADGPALIVANHPGWIDSFAALATITRPDVFFLVGLHPTLEYLPHFKEHLVFVNPKSVTNRAEAIRHVIEYLKDGKVVVIFPKGLLEPDPSLIPGAKQSILDWNDSVGVFLKKVPETVLQPMLISQMVLPKVWNHWAVKLFKEKRRRQQLAMVLQFAMSLRKKTGANWKTQARIDFGEAVSAYDLSPTLNPREISRNLKERILFLLTKIYPKKA